MTGQQFHREGMFQIERLKDRIYASTAGEEEDQIAMARASQVLTEEIPIFEKVLGYITGKQSD